MNPTAAVQLSPQNLLDIGTDKSRNETPPSELKERETVSSVYTTSHTTDGENAGEGDTGIKIGKKPKRIIHFVDGDTLEEYSTDEDEDQTDTSRIISTVNPKTLPWGAWIWYQTAVAGSVSLSVCDYLGERLASLFGITTPKYQYEIDEYNRMLAEEEESRKKEDIEMRGWKEENSVTPGDSVHTSQIKLSENAQVVTTKAEQRY